MRLCCKARSSPKTTPSTIEIEDPEEHWQPQPLSEDATSGGVILPQTQSPFLARLPLEIRRQIYEYVILDTVRRVHVQQSFRRFGSVVCREAHVPGACGQAWACIYDQLEWLERARGIYYGRFVLWDDTHLKCKLPINATYTRKRRHVDLMNLAFTCKFSGYDFLPTFYSTIVFVFSSISQFQLFSTTITSTALYAIQHLEFVIKIKPYDTNERVDAPIRPSLAYDRWVQGWKTVASLSALRTLHVKLGCHWDDLEGSRSVSRPEVEQRIFEPLKKVKQVRESFVVELGWTEKLNVELGDIPFDITRGPTFRWGPHGIRGY